MSYRPIITIPETKEIDWRYAYNFLPREFSEDPDIYAEPFLIHRLQDLRTRHGKPVYPSPVSGALARVTGSIHSQHYIGDSWNDIQCKSKAIDFFPEGSAMQCAAIAMRMAGINGVGIYLNTTGVDGKPWVMIHMDIRTLAGDIERPVIWIVDDNNNYCYPQSNPMYWELFQDKRLYEYRRKGKYGD